MNRLTLLLSGCLGVAATCQSAQAQDFRQRFYLGLGGGVSQLEPDTEGSIYSIEDDQDVSGRFTLGFDLSRRFSAELYLADLGESKLTPDSTVGYQVGGFHLLGYLFNTGGAPGLFYRDGLAMYVKVGAGGMENTSTGGVQYERLNDVNVSGGLGLEGLIGRGVSWRAEVDVYNTDAAQASISLVKRFGSAVETPRVASDREEQVEEAVSEAVASESADLNEIGAELEQTAQTEEASLADVAAQVTQAVVPVAPAPAGDSDGDGVRDVDDRCQGTQPGLSVDDRGCSFTGIAEGLYFNSGSTDLNASARAILDNIVIELQRYPNVLLEVQAHTDNRGNAADNLALSQRRAEQVAQYIVSRGIDPQRVRARGFGESRPAYRNATEEGRQRNRRVVFQTVEAVRP